MPYVNRRPYRGPLQQIISEQIHDEFHNPIGGGVVDYSCSWCRELLKAEYGKEPQQPLINTNSVITEKRRARTMMIFKPDTPRRYRYDTWTENGADAPSDTYVIPMLMPLVLGVCYILGLQVIDWLFLPDFLVNGAMGWPSVLLFPVVGYSLITLYWFRREPWVERRVQSGSRAAELETMFLDLPVDFRAEVATVRNLAYKYLDRGDPDGFEKCFKAIEKAHDAHDDRESEALEAQFRPAMAQVLHDIQRYQNETAGMFKQLEA